MMISHLKNLGIFLLTAMLSVGFLTACGNNQTSQQTTDETNTDQAEPEVQFVDLALKLEAEETYRMKITTTEDTTQTKFGETTKIKSESETIYKIDVVDVDEDGNTTLQYTYESIKNTSDGTLVFDSSLGTQTDNPQGRIYQTLIGNSYNVVLTSMGDIQSVSGIDELIGAMLDTVDSEIRDLVEPRVKSIVGEETIKDLMQTSFGMYAAEPVKVGDEWTESWSTTAGFAANFETIVKFTELTDNSVKLDTTMTLSNNPEAEALEFGSFKMRFKNLSGEGTGQFELDHTTGLFTTATIKQKFDAELELEGLEVITSDEPATINGTSETKYELLKS